MPTAQMPVRAPVDMPEAKFWGAWDEFFAALRRARGRAARDQGGLTLSQYRLLCAVEQAPLAGLRELSEEVGSSGPTLTRMLAALERDGVPRRRGALHRHPHRAGPDRRRPGVDARARRRAARSRLNPLQCPRPLIGTEPRCELDRSAALPLKAVLSFSDLAMSARKALRPQP